MLTALIAFALPATFLLVLPIKLLLSAIGFESTKAAISLLRDCLFRFLDFLFTKSFQSRLPLLFYLFWGHASLCCFVHHAKSLEAFGFLGLKAFFGLNPEALLSVFDLLIDHILSLDAESLCSLLLLPFIVLELLVRIDRCGCSASEILPAFLES